MDSDKVTSSIFLNETYFERIRDSKNPTQIRLKMIEYLLHCGSVTETSRKFNVSRKTVRKWEKRYYENGLEGLKDKPRGARTKPKSINSETKELIISLKLEYPNYGVRKIKSLLEKCYNIRLSIHPIYSTLKSSGLLDRKVGT